MLGDDFTTTRDSDASAMRSPGENDRQSPTVASASDDSNDESRSFMRTS